MFAYTSRAVVDFFAHDITDTFTNEMLFDWGTILWDAIPITMLLIFHYKNFKPHQHELIIRMQDESTIALSDPGNSQQDMFLI